MTSGMASGTHKEEEYFPLKLFRMVENKDYSEIIWWNKDGDGFFICEDQEEFLTSKILENYNFKTNSYGSFIRQLNNYGFHKKRRPNQEKANEPSSYYCHDKGYFKRSCSDLLMNITKTKGNLQGTKKEASSKKETGRKLNQRGINQDLSQSIKETETDSSFENVRSGSFPGIHVGLSEIHPYVKEGTSVSSQTQAWCSTPSVVATSQYSFPLAENMSLTSTIPKREPVQDFVVNAVATSALSCVGQSSVCRVGQMQSFGDTIQTQTIDILDILTQSGQYIPDELMYDVAGEASFEKTISQTGTSLIPDVGFSENMLLAPTTTTTAASVGGFDTSPFQSGGVPVPFMQQVCKGSSLPESLHKPAEPREQHLTDQYPLQDLDFPPLFTTELQSEVVVNTYQGSEMSETGYSSEESLNQPKELGQEIAVATNVTQDPCGLYQADGNAYSSDEGSSYKEKTFDVTINPESCRPEGGKCFWLEFGKSLPTSVTFAWAAFGPYGRVKIRTYDEDCTMFGKKIPPGRPGIVTVTVNTESGECLGETVFTYKNPKKKGNNQGLSNKRKLDELSAIVKDFAKKLKQFQQGEDGDESLKSAFKQGPLHQEKQLEHDKILKALVYAAAEAGAIRLIETIFSLPAGRVVFESYKEESSLPEDIAEENGHGKAAAYLRDKTKRYAEEQSVTPVQSRTNEIDWLKLANALEELELSQSVTERSSDKDLNQIWEDDITGTGYSADGETSSSGSGKEISDSDDEVHKMDAFKESSDNKRRQQATAFLETQSSKDLDKCSYCSQWLSDCDKVPINHGAWDATGSSPVDEGCALKTDESSCDLPPINGVKDLIDHGSSDLDVMNSHLKSTMSDLRDVTIPYFERKLTVRASDDRGTEAMLMEPHSNTKKVGEMAAQHEEQETLARCHSIISLQMKHLSRIEEVDSLREKLEERNKETDLRNHLAQIYKNSDNQRAKSVKFPTKPEIKKDNIQHAEGIMVKDRQGLLCCSEGLKTLHHIVEDRKILESLESAIVYSSELQDKAKEMELKLSMSALAIEELKERCKDYEQTANTWREQRDLYEKIWKETALERERLRKEKKELSTQISKLIRSRDAAVDQIINNSRQFEEKIQKTMEELDVARNRLHQAEIEVEQSKNAKFPRGASDLDVHPCKAAKKTDMNLDLHIERALEAILEEWVDDDKGSLVDSTYSSEDSYDWRCRQTVEIILDRMKRRIPMSSAIANGPWGDSTDEDSPSPPKGRVTFP